MAQGEGKVREQRNFLRDYDSMLKALMLDYVDCARYETSGYSEFIGKLYTLNGGMFQSPVYCDHILTQMMLHYLAWFQDPGIRLVVGEGAAWHMAGDCKVQRYGDALYVVEAAPDAPVRVGERIVGVNKKTLDEIRPEIERTLRTTVQPADPEREDWSIVLAFAKHLTVVGLDGVEREMKVSPGDSVVTARMKEYYAKRAAAAGEAVPEDPAPVEPADAEEPAKEEEPPCSLHRAGRAAVLRLAAPGDEGFADVLAGSLGELSRLRAAGEVDGLVVDVRAAQGGGQQDIHPLVGYLLPAGTTARPADAFGEPGILMNYSRHNVDAKLAELAALRTQLAAGENGLAEEDAAELDALEAELKERRGRGLAFDTTDYYDDVTFESAADGLAGVVVLVDRYTSDAAEWLAAAAKRLGGARVAGRATMGSLDNTCPRVIRLDEDFSLVIPTAKYLAATEGRATLGRGVVPDVHLAWTPEQLERDVELERACNLALQG